MRLVLALLALVATALADCPDGWKKFGSSCYKVDSNTDTNSFDKHLAECRKQGGSLASIHSQAQQDFIAGLVAPFAPSEVYLGLYDAFKNGTWVWADGTPLDYTNWGTGRPDNATGYEYCSQLATADGKWDDRDCCGGGIGVCQIPDPDACPCPRNWTHYPFTGFCYKLDYGGDSVANAPQRSFVEALQSCRAQGAELVSIHSAQEQAFIDSLAGGIVDVGQNWDNSFWLGLNRTTLQSPWVWSDGTGQLGGTAYGNVVVDNAAGALCAAFSNRYGAVTNGQSNPAGYWHDVYCTTSYKYGICKRKSDFPAGVAVQQQKTLPRMVRGQQQQ